MTSVAISPKFQVVIPKDVRQALQLRPGQRMVVRLDASSGTVVLEPEADIRTMRGLFPELSAELPADPEGPDWPGGCEPLPAADWLRGSDAEPGNATP